MSEQWELGLHPGLAEVHEPVLEADAGGKLEYALEIRVTLDTGDRELAHVRMGRILAALEHPSVRRQFGEWVTSEVYTY